MNKITRILAIVMAIAMMLCLTACGHEHTWADAACLSPRICTSCGETEGEALGHTWADATCSAPRTCARCGATEGEVLAHNWTAATCEAPKTCSLCGETEGEALGHTWTEANYQAPKTCSLCGATEGDKLISYFEEYGLDTRLCDKTAEHELEQTCGSDTNTTTVLKITVEDYKTITSDETHAAADGYEWKIMTIKMHMWDENAQRYGISTWNYLWDNIYVGEPSDPDGDVTGLFEDGMHHCVEWNGIEYEEGLLQIAESVGEWEKDDAGNYYRDIFVTVSVRVPVGYDGFVFGLEGYGWDWPDSKYLHEVITDDTLMFCLD